MITINVFRPVCFFFSEWPLFLSFLLEDFSAFLLSDLLLSLLLLLWFSWLLWLLCPLSFFLDFFFLSLESTDFLPLELLLPELLLLLLSPLSLGLAEWLPCGSLASGVTSSVSIFSAYVFLLGLLLFSSL